MSPRPIHISSILAALFTLLSIVGRASAADGSSAAAHAASIQSAAATFGRELVDVSAEAGSEFTGILLAADGQTLATSVPVTIPVLGRANIVLTDTDGEPVPMLPGNTLRLTSAGEVVLDELLPPLTIDADMATDLVTGTGEPGASIAVTVTKFPGQRADSTEVAAPDGSYSVDFSSEFDIARGTEIQATVESGELTVSAWWQFHEAVSATYWSSIVGVSGPDGSWVECRLDRPGDGAISPEGSTRLGLAGTGTIDLQDASGEPVVVMPGDTLQLDYVGMVSREYELPDITASPDSATDTVSGSAPPGSDVTVAVDSNLFETKSTTTAADDGSYSAEFTGRADIAPGGTGYATAAVGDEVEVTRVWGVAKLTVLIGSADIEGLLAGLGPPVGVSLYDAEGVLRAHASSILTPSGSRGRTGELSVRLVTREGSPEPVRTGDVIELRRGEEALELEIPVLTTAADTAADTIAGSAPPNSQVRIRVGYSLGWEDRESRAGPDGRYSLSLAGSIDLRTGKDLTAEISTAKGHVVSVQAGTGEALVWPVTGMISGRSGTSQRVEARIEDLSGTLLASASGNSDESGAFELALDNGSGENYRPNPGEQLVAEVGANSISFEIPEVTAQHDLDTDEVYGSATTSGNVWVSVQPPEGDGDDAVTKTARILFDPEFRLPFADEANLRPASRYRVTFRNDYGNGVAFDHIVPLANVQVHGNRVHGYGEPHETVDVTMTAGGAEVAAASCATGADQVFDLYLSDDRGQPEAIQEGSELQVTFGNGGHTVSIPVSQLSAQIDRDDWTMTGAAPSESELLVRRATKWQPAWRETLVASPMGTYTLRLPEWPSPKSGEQLEVDYRVGEGHRVYAVANSLRMAAIIGSDEVLCTAHPLSDATVILDRPAGGPGIVASGSVDTDGTALVSFDGRSKIVPGTKLRLQSGSDEVSMVVPMLTASVSRESGSIKGTLDPDYDLWPLDLVAHMRHEDEPLHMVVEAGAMGRYFFNPSDRGGYPPLYAAEDVEMAETWITVESGQQAIARAWPSTWLNIPFIKKQ
jgi:hypothetical protein